MVETFLVESKDLFGVYDGYYEQSMDYSLSFLFLLNRYSLKGLALVMLHLVDLRRLRTVW